MTTNPTEQRVSDELLDRWVEVSKGQTGAILTWPEMRDLIADLRVTREENRQLREQIDALVELSGDVIFRGGGSSD